MASFLLPGPAPLGVRPRAHTFAGRASNLSAVPLAPARPLAAARSRMVVAALKGYEDAEETRVTPGAFDVTERVVQWYPGHIAKAERLLKEQIKSVDVVIEVRDARIPFATEHPEIPQWTNGKLKVVVMNRVDMISEADTQMWNGFFRDAGEVVVWTDGKNGQGVRELVKKANAVGKKVNDKRRARGLRPRNVRAAIVGYPNVGKSALINRMLGKRYCDSAQRPGVTRQLRWLRVGGDIDLLDSPGVLPMRMADQDAAVRLAICNDIGDAAYLSMLAGASMVKIMRSLPDADKLMESLHRRYDLDPGSYTAEQYVEALGVKLFQGDPERAGERLLNDFRKQHLGAVCLELPHRPGDRAREGGR